MAFNKAAAKKAGYSDQEIEQYLAQKVQSQPQQQPLEAMLAKTGLFDIPVAGGILRNLESSGESYGRMALGAGYEGQRAVRSSLGDKTQYGVNAQGKQKQNPFLSNQELQTFSNPKTAIPEAIGRTTNAALSAYTVAKLPSVAKAVVSAPKAAKYLRHPLKTTGAKIEAKATSAGEVPQSLIDKFFNSPEAKAKIMENVGTASDKGKMARILRGEVGTQGQTPGGGISGPTFKEFLRNRTGSYAKGRYATGTPPTAENQLWRNIGKQYDEILKEGAGTASSDKIYSLLKNIEKTGKGGTGYLVKYVIPSFLFYKLFGGMFGGK